LFIIYLSDKEMGCVLTTNLKRRIEK